MYVHNSLVVPTDWHFEFESSIGMGHENNSSYTGQGIPQGGVDPDQAGFLLDIFVEAPAALPHGVVWPFQSALHYADAFQNPAWNPVAGPEFGPADDGLSVTTANSAHREAVVAIRFRLLQKEPLAGQVLPTSVTLQFYNFEEEEWEEKAIYTEADDYQYVSMYVFLLGVSLDDDKQYLNEDDQPGIVFLRWRLVCNNGDGTVVYGQEENDLSLWTVQPGL